jgi:hypothetical protein
MHPPPEHVPAGAYDVSVLASAQIAAGGSLQVTPAHGSDPVVLLVLVLPLPPLPLLVLLPPLPLLVLLPPLPPVPVPPLPPLLPLPLVLVLLAEGPPPQPTRNASATLVRVKLEVCKVALLRVEQPLRATAPWAVESPGPSPLSRA